MMDDNATEEVTQNGGNGLPGTDGPGGTIDTGSSLDRLFAATGAGPTETDPSGEGASAATTTGSGGPAHSGSQDGRSAIGSASRTDNRSGSHTSGNEEGEGTAIPRDGAGSDLVSHGARGVSGAQTSGGEATDRSGTPPVDFLAELEASFGIADSSGLEHLRKLERGEIVIPPIAVPKPAAGGSSVGERFASFIEGTDAPREKRSPGRPRADGSPAQARDPNAPPKRRGRPPKNAATPTPTPKEPPITEEEWGTFATAIVAFSELLDAGLWYLGMDTDPLITDARGIPGMPVMTFSLEEAETLVDSYKLLAKDRPPMHRAVRIVNLSFQHYQAGFILATKFGAVMWHFITQGLQFRFASKTIIQRDQMGG